MKYRGIVALILVAATHAAAADWYVSASASSPGNGSAASPYASLQAGVSAAKPGDRVIVRAGLYRESVTMSKTATRDAPILITAYPGERPVVSGSLPVSGWRLDHGSVWRHDAWTIDSQQVFVDGAPLQQIGMPAGLGTGIASDGTTMITPVGTDATSLFAGSFYVDRAAGVLYAWLSDSSDPNQHAIEASAKSRLLMMNASTWVTVSGLTFQHTNLTATSSAGAAVELGSWCTLRDCDVEWCDFCGVAMGYLQQNSQAIGVRARNNGCLGFGASGTNGFLISQCTIANNNYRMFNRNWQAGGAKMASKAWGTFEGCDVVGNLGQGIWFDYANSGNPIVVRGCRVRDNANFASGIMVEVSRNVMIHDNLISGNARRGVYVAASNDVDVAANTITGNQGMNAIDVSGMPRAGATLTDVRIRNNLVVDNRGTLDLMLLRENGTDILNLSSDHNLFLRTAGDVALWSGLDARDGWRGTTYTSLQAWQNATLQDLHSVQADPRCIDRANGDFRLAVGSPAIDAGDALPYALDFAGVVRTLGASPDIGAFENWAPIVTPMRLTAAVGRPVSAAVVATNGPTAFSGTGFPDGVALDPATGVISGVPRAGGTCTASVCAMNGGGAGTAVVVFDIDAPPTVVNGPVAGPTTDGKSCAMSVVFADDGGAGALTYRWGSASGMVDLTPIDAAGTMVQAAFPDLGDYTISVTATDAQGLATTASCVVSVTPRVATLSITPATAELPLNATQTFTASATDQFGHPMVAAGCAWSVDGTGSVDGNGQYSSGGTPGVGTITARCGGLAAVAVASVVNTAPRLIRAPSAQVSAKSVSLSVVADDDGGAADLTTVWSVASAPTGAEAAFTATADGEAATVSMPGDYLFSVVVSDAGGLSVRGTVSATVAAVASDLVMTPTTASVTVGGTVIFSATVRDQFAQPLAPQPPLTWSATGGGTISADGRFTAAAVGTAQVTATAGTVTGAATITVGRAMFAAKINFQPAAAPAAVGYLTDSGLVYGARPGALSYGWNAACESRDRDAVADQRYDTLVLMQAPSNPDARWEVAVPNGTYSVHVVCGDPSYFDGSFNLLVEGIVAVTGRATSTAPFHEGTVTVTVSDGRLTLTNGSGSYNTKICYIEIQQMPTGTG